MIIAFGYRVRSHRGTQFRKWATTQLNDKIKENAMKTIIRMILAILFTFAGILHFLRETNFTKIIPSYIPLKKEITYITGIMEVIMGIYLFMKRPSTNAKKWINRFLLAVFPANVYMARKQLPLGNKQLSQSALYGRLPLQFALMKLIKWL